MRVCFETLYIYVIYRNIKYFEYYKIYIYNVETFFCTILWNIRYITIIFKIIILGVNKSVRESPGEKGRGDVNRVTMLSRALCNEDKRFCAKASLSARVTCQLGRPAKRVIRISRGLRSRRNVRRLKSDQYL